MKELKSHFKRRAVKQAFSLVDIIMYYKVMIIKTGCYGVRIHRRMGLKYTRAGSSKYKSIGWECGEG